jgi:hypothetical protein
MAVELHVHCEHMFAYVEDGLAESQPAPSSKTAT